MAHDLKYAVLVPEITPIGETALAAARKAIIARYGVSPVEVFLDGVQSDGVVHAGDIDLDLDLLKLRLYTFGASSDGAVQVAPATGPVQAAPVVDTSVQAPVSADAPAAVTTTTTTES